MHGVMVGPRDDGVEIGMAQNGRWSNGFNVCSNNPGRSQWAAPGNLRTRFEQIADALVELFYPGVRLSDHEMRDGDRLATNPRLGVRNTAAPCR